MDKVSIIETNYKIKVAKAIEECETIKLSFNKWMKYYGLYCLGKDINSLVEVERLDQTVDTIELGQALCNATLGDLTREEKEMLEISRKSVSADLILERLGKKLSLIP